ncbi:MAG: hydantoinase/oxoprolinase family protein [Alteromonadaceae bacterium TMED7]|nr:MAG: hydantoinase/oxoprolinase family protein [Alteromonadaceae bacterium TMED7]|tara:strand:- start:10380 stop:12317 length:1938 start_codon:yes stop_codon:yes gene_type:complete
MGKLINIDNGGTLTDFCALDNGKVYHTKSLTTPFDLSKCFFDGLSKLARDIYGDEKRVSELLQSTDYIRYSTTQGTNALVERKGPRLGLLVSKGDDLSVLKETTAEASLFKDLVDDRIGELDFSLSGDALETSIVRAVNSVASAGASRIILSINVGDFKQVEDSVSRVVGRKFPSHLLGVVPVLPAGELSDDLHYGRRTWSALLNSFLHPAMERFLYSADHRLKDHKTKNPLLIFRNDGGAARVAKTMAIKSYSSGPRGGMEGVKALSEHYGFKKLLSYDVGGTTTDIGVVNDGVLTTEMIGKVEGVEVNFPLADIFSAGVGGSSVIAADDGVITVGPESVGAAPGPACFGLGGTQATITDVFLLLGVLDSSTYFGGELSLDEARSETAIMTNIANPLGLSLYEALEQMFQAWVQKIANGLQEYSPVDSDTTLAGFGGAGALAATRIADAYGAKQIIIPALGAVFCAVGIGFSPISQVYRVSLSSVSDEALKQVLSDCRARAAKDLYAEGVDISECDISVSLLNVLSDGTEQLLNIDDSGSVPSELASEGRVTLTYEASKTISSLEFEPVGGEVSCEAKVNSVRKVRTSEYVVADVPVIRLEEQVPGATIDGPVIIEESFFTGLVDEGWKLSVSGNRDIILNKNK